MTIKEIAKEAGVSTSTVSRVINQKGPHVARPEIQNKIWEIVSREGYSPNENAIGLKRKENNESFNGTKSIACLFARTPESINDPFFSQLARSVEAEAFKEGYYAQYSLTAVDMHNAERLHSLVDHHVQGVVVLGRCDKDLLRLLKKYFKFVVYAGLNPLDAGCDQIICNGYDACMAAVKHLYSLGHEKIAYIGELTAENRFTGYIDGLEQCGLEKDDRRIVEVNLCSEGGYLGAKELIEKAEDVSAVICANDMTAIGAMRGFKEAGINVPQDLSIISIDDIDMAQYMAVKLTTVHIPVDEMGQLATKVLLDRMRNGHKIPMKVELPFYIVERESCMKTKK